MAEREIHIGSDLSLDGAVRNMVAAAFGRAGNLASTVSTGCGLRVPRSNTSRHAADVTCLVCRQYAHEQHLAHADQIERLGEVPGMGLTAEQLRAAVDASRELAREFAKAGRGGSIRPVAEQVADDGGYSSESVVR